MQRHEQRRSFKVELVFRDEPAARRLADFLLEVLTGRDRRHPYLECLLGGLSPQELVCVPARVPEVES